MSLNNKTFDNHSHKRKKLKFNAMMLKDTENNTRIFLLRKRSKFYKLKLMHITRNRNPFHLKTKNYLTRIIFAAQNKHHKSFSPDQRDQDLKKDAAKHKKTKKVSLS